MKRGRRGQILVEFALVTPLLVSLLLGAMNFGYAFYTYNNLIKAVRDAARYASMRTYKGGDATFAPAVKNMVVFGVPNPAAGAKPIVHNLTVGAVDVTTPTGSMTTVKVGVITYTMSLPLGNITLTNKPYSTFRYTGRYIP